MAIYLIEDKDKSGVTINKVGYASDLKKRMYSYEDHHPSFKVRKVMKGSALEEKILHKYLSHKGLGCGFKVEWYDKCSEIDRLFEDHDRTFLEAGKYLWENRKSTFSKSDLEKDHWYNYYQYLERTFNNEKPETLKDEIKAY